MVINKDKVICIPKEFRDNDSAFVCPCPVCVQKLYAEREEKAQIEHAKSIIENIFETSALNSQDFSINVSYADTVPEVKEIKRYPEVKATFAASKLTLSFTSQFNKKYRHPLMCKLRSLAEEVQQEATTYSAMVQYGDVLESRLWKLEEVAKKISKISFVLDEIESEEFLDKEKVKFVKEKIVLVNAENKSQLKKLFINALKIPEFEPHCTYDEFHLPYY